MDASHHILHLVAPCLDIGAKLACRAVSRGWRATFSVPSVWRTIDLSQLAHDDALLSFLASLASVSLVGLDVSQPRAAATKHRVCTVEGVLAAAAANQNLEFVAVEGRNKDYDSRWTVKQVTALCAAAPRLKSFVVDVRGTWNVEMEDLLRNKPPFTSVSACTLSLSFPGPEDHGDYSHLFDDSFTNDAALPPGPSEQLKSFASSLEAHGGGTWELSVDIPKVTAAALDALADGTYKHALSSDVIDAFPALDGVYHFHTENQLRISTPFLTRLLSSDLVSMKLHFHCSNGIFSGSSEEVTELIDTIPDSLVEVVEFSQAKFFSENPDAAVAALGAWTGHQFLEVLKITEERVNNNNAPEGQTLLRVTQALGRIVAAVTLVVLCVDDCGLGDDGLRPIFAALQNAKNMCGLGVRGNDVTESFARTVVLPAVKASSLTWIDAAEIDGSIDDIDFGDDSDAEQERAKMLAADAVMREAEEFLDARSGIQSTP